MNILEIYKKYHIMPQLAEHQLKVAAVASLICENSTPLPNPPHKGEGINRHNIVAACLLHDMGNIVKFDLRMTEKLFLGDFKTQPVSYWENIQREFISKYGTGSHNATMKIIKEIGVSRRIQELVDCVGFGQAKDNLVTADFGKKICAYSDMRVLPQGVGSLDDRLADLQIRYDKRKEATAQRDLFENALRQIERQIFKHSDIKPGDITDQSILAIKENLKSYRI